MNYLILQSYIQNQDILNNTPLKRKGYFFPAIAVLVG